VTAALAVADIANFPLAEAATVIATFGLPARDKTTLVAPLAATDILAAALNVLTVAASPAASMVKLAEPPIATMNDATALTDAAPVTDALVLCSLSCVPLAETEVADDPSKTRTTAAAAASLIDNATDDAAPQTLFKLLADVQAMPADPVTSTIRLQALAAAMLTVSAPLQDKVAAPLAADVIAVATEDEVSNKFKLSKSSRKPKLSRASILPQASSCSKLGLIISAIGLSRCYVEVARANAKDVACCNCFAC
jgi:hypothetical protein